MQSNYMEKPAARQPEPKGGVEHAFPNALRFVV